jgi:hypothetical protein
MVNPTMAGEMSSPELALATGSGVWTSLRELLKKKDATGILTVTGSRRRGDGARPAMSSMGGSDSVLNGMMVGVPRSVASSRNFFGEARGSSQSHL